MSFGISFQDGWSKLPKLSDLKYRGVIKDNVLSTITKKMCSLQTGLPRGLGSPGAKSNGEAPASRANRKFSRPRPLD